MTPYGIPESKGGESPKNEEKMVRCVRDLMAKGHDKVSAVKICKAGIFGKGK